MHHPPSAAISHRGPWLFSPVARNPTQTCAHFVLHQKDVAKHAASKLLEKRILLQTPLFVLRSATTHTDTNVAAQSLGSREFPSRSNKCATLVSTPARRRSRGGLRRSLNHFCEEDFLRAVQTPRAARIPLCRLLLKGGDEKPANGRRHLRASVSLNAKGRCRGETESRFFGQVERNQTQNQHQNVGAAPPRAFANCAGAVSASQCWSWKVKKLQDDERCPSLRWAGQSRRSSVLRGLSNTLIGPMVRAAFNFKNKKTTKEKTMHYRRADSAPLFSLAKRVGGVSFGALGGPPSGVSESRNISHLLFCGSLCVSATFFLSLQVLPRALPIEQRSSLQTSFFVAALPAAPTPPSPPSETQSRAAAALF